MVRGVSLTVRYPSGEQNGASDEEGRFRFIVPAESLTLRIEGQYLISREMLAVIRQRVNGAVYCDSSGNG